MMADDAEQQMRDDQVDLLDEQADLLQQIHQDLVGVRADLQRISGHTAVLFVVGVLWLVGFVVGVIAVLVTLLT